MTREQEYLERLKLAVGRFHKCKVIHSSSVWVHHCFKDGTEWRGPVEVFVLKDHPKAVRCYAWSSWGCKDECSEFKTVLEIPPVESAEAAVQAAIIGVGRLL